MPDNKLISLKKEGFEKVESITKEQVLQIGMGNATVVSVVKMSGLIGFSSLGTKK